MCNKIRVRAGKEWLFYQAGGKRAARASCASRALSASSGPEKGFSNGKGSEQHLENATPTL
jgi:hypothetical protein